MLISLPEPGPLVEVRQRPFVVLDVKKSGLPKEPISAVRDHGFHETKQGLRFTISQPARGEVLDRLLALNHERYQQEVEMGLHDKKRKKKTATRGRKKNTSAQEELF